MVKVLPQGAAVKFRGEDYVVTKILSIEPDRVLYCVIGDGYKRILADNEIEWQNDEILQTVVPVWHYKMDFKMRKIYANEAYAIVVKSPSATRPDKYLLYGPLYLGFQTSAFFGKVTDSFDLVLETRNDDLAKIKLSNKVAERLAYFEDKVSEYVDICRELNE